MSSPRSGRWADLARAADVARSVILRPLPERIGTVRTAASHVLPRPERRAHDEPFGPSGRPDAVL